MPHDVDLDLLSTHTHTTQATTNHPKTSSTASTATKVSQQAAQPSSARAKAQAKGQAADTLAVSVASWCKASGLTEVARKHACALLESKALTEALGGNANSPQLQTCAHQLLLECVKVRLCVCVCMLPLCY